MLINQLCKLRRNVWIGAGYPEISRNQINRRLSGHHCVARGLLKERHSGWFLRSSQPATALTITSRNTTKHLELELQTLGLKSASAGAVPFPVPAGKVCDLYDLYLVTLGNLQQHLAKREAERDARKQSAASSLPQPSPSTAAAAAA